MLQYFRNLKMMFAFLAVALLCTTAEAGTTCPAGENRKCTGSSDGMIVKTGLNPDQQKKIVDMHNQLRAQLAQGGSVQGADGTLPNAANMVAMVWNSTLAPAAQIHSEGCEMKHFKPAGYPSDYGQNLAYSGSTAPISEFPIEAMVQKWWDEYKKFSVNSINPFKSTDETGHFTQMAWAKSTSLGCGITYYCVQGQKFPYQILLTCDYYPTGNMNIKYADGSLHGDVYVIGPPATQCTSGKDGTYSNLCANGQPK